MPKLHAATLFSFKVRLFDSLNLQPCGTSITFADFYDDVPLSFPSPDSGNRNSRGSLASGSSNHLRQPTTDDTSFGVNSSD
jgi:hypothetical protein